jgi:alkanesulfonate monooxygenase SsuD/methylene tetrahydromethanopterin reductase-like flavin-dependent oxidoreductase (luciferase family)
MKLGSFSMPIHPIDRPLVQTLNEDREYAILADKLGFSEALFGEHLTDAAETVTSALIFIAWCLRETKNIKLGAGTVNLPNHHPVMVAGEVAMLDHMSEGRFIMGISPGGLMSDAEIFGNLDKDRNAMLVESMNMILDLWSKDPPYNLKGQFWNISVERTMIPEIGQGFVHRPYQRPHPPIVVTAVAPFSKGVTEAAARGWDMISANFLQPEWVKTHWPNFVEGRQRIGQTADPSSWRVARSIFVADDMATARRYVTDPNGPYQAYYKSLVYKLVKGGRANLFKKDQKAPDSSVTTEGVVNDLVIWGTPEKVAEDILKLREQVGPFGTLYYAGHDWQNKHLAQRSMVLLAEKVMPKVNAALGESW